MSRYRERAPELVVALLATLVYLFFASRWLVGRSDAAEYAALAARGGVAHPPGYPLYVLWLRLFAWLPTTVAHRASLATALAGGLGIASMQWACRSWGASRTASACVSAIYALSPIAWEQATAPEVFVPSVAIAMTIVAVCGPGALPSLRGPRRVGLLALLAGLGLSNQQTIVLLAPLGLVAAVKEARGAWPRALGYGLGGLCLGLTPYAYLPFASRYAPEACVTGDFRSFGAVVDHFLRAEYGTFKMSALKEEPAPLAQIALLGRSFAASLVWLPIALGLPFVRRGAWPSRALLAALGASLVLAGPVFASRMTFTPRGGFVVIAERFHLLPLALAALVAALVLDRFLDRFSALGRTGFAVLAGVSLLSLVRVAWVATSSPWYTPMLEHYLANVYRTLPPNALWFSRSDALLGAEMYARCTDDPRPDVATINAARLFAGWYQDRIERTTGIAYHPVERVVYGADLVSRALATGRPVYLTEWFAPKLEEKFPSYPVGPLVRIVARPGDLPSPSWVVRANEELFAGFALESPPPEDGTWAGNRYRDYQRPWLVLGAAFEAMGSVEAAAACRERARLLAPTSAD